tara:strand:- start:170 stop:520 length:351 start_codon:yes stop_codon:yes gene_type:complete
MKKYVISGLLLLAFAVPSWAEQEEISVELPTGKTIQVPAWATEEKIKEYAIDVGLATQRDYDQAVALKVQQGIFNACLLDKSSGLDMQVKSIEEAVIAVCKTIAEDPSWMESLQYD